MTIFYALLASYLMFSLLRIVYQIASGFLYTRPPELPRLIDAMPKVSIVVPAWNEEVGVVKTIKSVMSNGYGNIEIIVVNDGSTDATGSAIAGIKKLYGRGDRRLRVISQQNTGKAGALNAGIAAAKGVYIITLDADSYLTPGSINELVRAMKGSTYAAAMGEVVIGNTKTLLGRAQFYEYLVGFHFKRAQHVFKSAYIFPGALTMFRASVLRRVGQFEDYSSTEDLDISMRIKAAGYQVAYVDSATCITEGATSIRGLINQRTRWRHGFIDCIVHRRDFVWSTKKGKYLSYIDFPLSIIGMVEVFLLPVIIVFLSVQLASNFQLPIFILSYLLLPAIFLMLGSLHNDRRVTIAGSLSMPILLLLLNLVECIALAKALYRFVARKKTTWTVWSRTGAN